MVMETKNKVAGIILTCLKVTYTYTVPQDHRTFALFVVSQKSRCMIPFPISFLDSLTQCGILNIEKVQNDQSIKEGGQTGRA